MLYSFNNASSLLLLSSSSAKYGRDVYHPGYKYYRASSWGKLPALWYATELLHSIELALQRQQNSGEMDDKNITELASNSSNKEQDMFIRFLSQHNRNKRNDDQVKNCHILNNSSYISTYYDYIWFMDSDSAPNIMHREHSLGDALQLWHNTRTSGFTSNARSYSGSASSSSSSSSSIEWGQEDVYNASFIFLNNFPWRDDLPCAGNKLSE